MRPLILSATLALLLFSTAVIAQDPSSGSPSSSSPQAANADADRDTGPVPVPEPSELAIQHYRSGIVLWLVDLAWGLLIPAAFLFTGFSARIRNWAARIGKK